MVLSPRCRIAAILLALAPAAPAAATDARPGPEADLAGTWNGTYVCPQGVTGLTLTFAADGRDGWIGRFRFFAPSTNPGVPSGAFGVSAHVDTAEGLFHVEPALWVDRPPGYVTVALVGEISPDGQSFAGEVLSEGCTIFRLKRLTS